MGHETRRQADAAQRRGKSRAPRNPLTRRDLQGFSYIQLERDPADGRARIIRYTERGWRMFDPGSRLSREIGQRSATAIGQERYEQFAATLRAIVDLNGPDRPR